MSTPIERGTEAICASRPHPGGGSEIVYEDAEDFARAVLVAALDRDELADVIRSQVLGASAFAQSVRYELADAIIALLTDGAGS